MSKIVKFLSQDLKSVDEANYTVEAIISTDDEDRHGEIVKQSGWSVERYKENPVVLFSHDNDQPIGKAIDINVGEKATTAKIKFAVEENPRVLSLWKMVKGGYLKGISVGFINKLREGNELIENELIEISLVAVPANANAFVLALENGTINQKDATWLKNTMKSEIKALDKMVEKVNENENSELIDLMTTLNSTITELKQSVNTLAEKLDTEDKTDEEAVIEEVTASETNEAEDSETDSDDSDKVEQEADSTGTDEEEDEELTDEEVAQIEQAVEQALIEEDKE